jgi:hypothetical protein
MRAAKFVWTRAPFVFREKQHLSTSRQLMNSERFLDDIAAPFAGGGEKIPA